MCCGNKEWERESGRVREKEKEWWGLYEWIVGARAREGESKREKPRAMGTGMVLSRRASVWNGPSTMPTHHGHSMTVEQLAIRHRFLGGCVVQWERLRSRKLLTIYKFLFLFVKYTNRELVPKDKDRKYALFENDSKIDPFRESCVIMRQDSLAILVVGSKRQNQRFDDRLVTDNREEMISPFDKVSIEHMIVLTMILSELFSHEIFNIRFINGSSRKIKISVSVNQWRWYTIVYRTNSSIVSYNLLCDSLREERFIRMKVIIEYKCK